MTKEEIVEAISEDKMMPFIQPEHLAGIVDFVVKNYMPSLPSDLDEAAEETAKKYYCSCLEKHNETGICDGCENVKLSFKAGAEWMAGQGETFNGFMSVKGKRSLIAIEGSSQNFKYGDNIIVQIRKKQ